MMRNAGTFRNLFSIAVVALTKNHQMLFVTGGRDAHGLLRKSQPDLTLMDVQIPDPNDIAAT